MKRFLMVIVLAGTLLGTAFAGDVHSTDQQSPQPQDRLVHPSPEIYTLLAHPRQPTQTRS